MPTAEKERTIEQAKEWYSKSVGVLFTDYRGMPVQEMQKLRTELRAKGGEMHVLKNTLFRRAAGDDAANLPDDLHNGPTAVTFVMQNEAECAKLLFDYAKSTKILKIKGGFFAGKAFSEKQIQALSELPPREVLIAQVIGAVAAPLSNLVGVIEALYADPIRVIGAVADKVAEGSPAPVKAEAKAEEAPVAEAPAPVAEEPAAAEAATEEAPVAELAAEEAPVEASAEPEAAE